MSDVWPKVHLSEVLQQKQERAIVVAGSSYKRITVRLFSQGVILRDVVDGAAIRTATQYFAKEGQFVFSRIDARNGAFGIVPANLNNSVVSGNFLTFDVVKDKLSPVYLRYFTERATFWEDCAKISEGTTNRVPVRLEEFLKLTIPLPPLAEQQRIVMCIEELAGKIAEARSLRQQALEEAKLSLASRVSDLFKTGANNGWLKGTLGDYVVDACYGTSEKTSDDASGTPILRMGNIQAGRLDFRDLKYLHLSEKDRDKLFLERGDILINRTNSAELVGKCAVFEADREYAFASYLIRLRLDQHRADPRLVAAYINSPIGREYMLSEKKQMTGQANVNSKKLQALPIALPSLEEQRHIVTELVNLQAKTDVLKRLQIETAAELDAMLPAILDRAFKGEL